VREQNQNKGKNMKEEDILHENGNHWISQARNGNFTVWTAGATHSTSEIEFEDLSIAKAYCDYKAKTKENLWKS
jgi:hypothetical protein